MANHFNILALRTPWTVGKGKKIWHESLWNLCLWKFTKDKLPRSGVPNMLLDKSGEIATERIKRRSQSKNNTQLCMWLVMEVKSNAVKNNIALEPVMLGPLIKVNWKWSNGWWQEWTLTFKESPNWNGLEWEKNNSDNHYIYYCGQESLRRME